MPSPYAEDLVRQLEERPDAILASPEIRVPEIFDAWIRRCLELTTSSPREGLSHVSVALLIASTPCQHVQCFGVKAAAHRSLGELDKALWLIEEAFELSRGCAGCEADLIRRRAHVYTSLGKQAFALRDADASVRVYQELSGPDHDLLGCGLADAHLSRGDIRQFFGGLKESLEDFSAALVLSKPDKHSTLYGFALSALGDVLRRIGGYSNLLMADQHIRQAWSYFNGRRHEPNRERAHLNWQTAMVRFELRRHPEGRLVVTESPAKLRGKMKRSLSDFLKMGMPAESVAVAADLSLLAFPERMPIIKLMDGSISKVREHWPSFTPEVREAFVPVDHAMRAVRRAANHDVTTLSTEEFHDRLRAAIERLRETCAKAARGQLLPCLLSWPG